MDVFLVSAGGIVGIALTTLLVGLAIGIVGTSLHFKNQIKKNPPRFREEDIKRLWSQSGRKLSETQVRKIMKELHQND